jgi:hypothetical protein
MTLALKEWHVVSEAIARGDQVLTLRKGGIREKAFVVPGSAFWLLPTWEHQAPAEVKRAWHGELGRSNRERRADGRLPVRCHCELAAAWDVTEPAVLAELDRWHLWTPAYAESRLRWRPGKPLSVLLVRASALLEPALLPPSEHYAGCTSWVELEEEPSGKLIPSLTDDAFAMRRDLVSAVLGEPAPALVEA